MNLVMTVRVGVKMPKNAADIICDLSLEQFPESTNEVHAREGSGAVWVDCDHVLLLWVLDVLGAADLEGPEIVGATLTHAVRVAKKCWESNQ